MIEFVAKEASWNPEDDFTGTTKSGLVNIMSIFPPDRDSLTLGSELHMLIHLDKPIDVRQAAERLPDLSHLCQLRNQYDKKKLINPKKHFYDKDAIKLTFDFHKDGNFVNQVFNDNHNKD